jgi:hypothetical protein
LLSLLAFRTADCRRVSCRVDVVQCITAEQRKLRSASGTIENRTRAPGTRRGRQALCRHTHFVTHETHCVSPRCPSTSLLLRTCLMCELCSSPTLRRRVQPTALRALHAGRQAHFFAHSRAFNRSSHHAPTHTRDTMPILSHDELMKAIDAGELTITPFDASAVGSASIDLRLSNVFRVFKARAPGDGHSKTVVIDDHTDFNDLTDRIEMCVPRRASGMIRPYFRRATRAPVPRASASRCYRASLHLASRWSVSRCRRICAAGSRAGRALRAVRSCACAMLCAPGAPLTPLLHTACT